MRMIWFRCRRFSLDFFGYKNRYYPFGVNLGFFGVRVLIEKPTFIKNKRDD